MTLRQIDAKEFAVLCASYGDFEPRYLVRFDDLTAGIFPFGTEEAEDVRAYPGVECVFKLKPGTYIELDPRSLAFTLSA